MEQFANEYNIKIGNDSERKIWGAGRKNYELYEMDHSDDIESDFSDPGSSVSAHCSNYSNTFIPSNLADWLPPQRLNLTQFNGMPTFVDHDGVIYMHDADRG